MPLKFVTTNNQFSKVVGYKINIQILVSFLYTISEVSKKEINKTILLASETINY